MCRYFAVLAFAATVTAATLTFEGIPDGSPIADTYSGLGIWFVGGVALIDSDDGGNADMGGEPSPFTALYSVNPVTVNVAAGVVNIRLYYSNPSSTTTIRMYSELDGRGEVVAEENLPSSPLSGAPDPTGPFSPFVFASMSGVDVARSIMIVTRGTGGLFVDDLTLQIVDATQVPEPTTSVTLIFALAVFAARWRRGRSPSI